MKRRTKLQTLKQIGEINLTPLMDLTFLLFITFVIAFPMVEQGIAVNLPKASAREVDAKHTQTISMDAKGQAYLNDTPVSMEELGARMRELKQADPETAVLVRADETVRYGEVVKILKVLYDANVSRMSLVTEAEPQKP